MRFLIWEMDTMKIKDMKNFTKAFFTALEYNWLYKDTLLTIKRGLENGNTQQTSYNIDECFMWSILVCMFGDYGTSPRSGWIVNVKECIEFIDKNLKGGEDEK